MNNGNLWFTVFDVMNVIGGAREGIHRHCHGANLCSPEERSDEFCRIREHDENAVALRNALFPKRVTGTIGKCRERGIRYGLRITGDSNLVRMARGLSKQKVFSNIEAPRNTCATEWTRGTRRHF